MRTLNSRIAIILEEKNIKHAEFAKVVGVSRSYVTSVVNSDKKPSIEMLIGIACHYRDINEHWLLTGEGSIYHTYNDDKENTNPEICKVLKEWWEKTEEKERNWLEVEIGRLLRGK